MSELVERLRDYASNLGGDPEDYLTWQAADRIEELETALARVERVDNSLAKQLGQSMAINAKLHARIARAEEQDK